MTFRISRRANADIEDICDYIAKDNERIHESIQMLAVFQGMGYGWKPGYGTSTMKLRASSSVK